MNATGAWTPKRAATAPPPELFWRLHALPPESALFGGEYALSGCGRLALFYLKM